MRSSAGRLRRVVCLLAAALLLPALPAAASETRKVKAIRRALVAIEFRLDDATRAIQELRDEARALPREIASARRDLRREMRKPVTGFEWFVLAGDFALLEGLELRLDEVEGGIAENTQEVWALVARRGEKIDELELLAQRSRKVDPSGSLIVGGSIITYSADWEAVAQCESSGRWHIDAKYDGGLQFDPLTWIGFGGGEFARYAHQASKTEQIAVAERVLAIQGPRAWPNCFRPLPVDFDE